MWSRYLCTRERDGIVAIFHELHPDPLYCPVLDWQELRKGAGKHEMLLSQLRARGLVVANTDEDDNAFADAENRLLEKLHQATILYLMSAQGCDFNCAYCPVQDIVKLHGASLLSSEDARSGIDLWGRHLNEIHDPDGDYYVIFYGGEPLLNVSVIEDSLAYLSEQKQAGKLPHNVRFMVATNGSQVDLHFVEMCKQYGMGVAVGLDGPREMNDAFKTDLQGGPTYERIVSAIRLLVAEKIPTYVSCSITPQNIEYVEHLGEFFEKLGIEKFGFNFLRGQKLIELVGENGQEAYYRKAARAVIRQSRLQARPGFEFQMEKKTLAFTGKDFFPVDCTCYGNQLVIQPDGEISNCPFFKAHLGHVQRVGPDFRIWDQPIVHDWRKRLPLYHSGEAKSLSGGGCVWGVIDQGHGPGVCDAGSQIFAEEVLNEFIWSTYHSS